MNVLFRGRHKLDLSKSSTEKSSKSKGKKLIEKEKAPEIFPIKNPPLYYQKELYLFYMAPACQFAVAGLIFFNFFVEGFDKQLLAEEGSSEKKIFIFFEYFFGIVFTIELVINMYGSWPIQFWKSAWNWFDFFIVGISVTALAIADLPGISVLRLFRAFRVFRLFKRIPSLRRLIEAVIASMPGVINAFVVLGILMGIWSIMGVEFFKPYADEEFGTFIRAMFSMFQVMTMDSWSSEIGRGIIFDNEVPAATFFFISYLFVAGIVMMNVIVAILLENYLSAIEVFDENNQNNSNEQNEIEEKTEAQKLKEGEQDLANKKRLMLTVVEVLPEDIIKNFERKQLIELFCALYSHSGARNKIKMKLGDLEEKEKEQREKHLQDYAKSPLVQYTE